MADVLKLHGALLGLGKTAIEPVKAQKRKASTYLAGITVVLVILGAGIGAGKEYQIKKEKAEQAAAALAETAEREKTRVIDAQLKRMSDLGMRYQYQLEQARKEVYGVIENLESYRDKIPQVKKFLAEYQLPADVRKAISEPVDLQSARSTDSHAYQVLHVAEPQNLEQARAKWEEILSAAGRYKDAINRNTPYFKGELRSMDLDEQFKSEFGMQQAPAEAMPLVEAAPVEPVVEQVVAEPAAPVAAAKPAPAPKPAVRPAAPKRRTVQMSDGRTKVLDF